MRNLDIKIANNLHVTNAQLVDAVALETGVSSATVELFIRKMAGTISTAMAKGGRIEIRNFAVFEGRSFPTYKNPLPKVRFPKLFQVEMTGIFDKEHREDKYYERPNIPE